MKLSLRGPNENNICPAVIFWWCTAALGFSRWATICELLQKCRPLTPSSLQVRVMAADNGLCVSYVQIIGNLKQSARFLWQRWFDLRSTEEFHLTSREKTDCLQCDLWPLRDKQTTRTEWVFLIRAEMMEGWVADRQKPDPMEVRDVVVSADGGFYL